MNCMPVTYEAVVEESSLPEKDLQGGTLAQEVRNRRAAASCLRAAAMAESAADRELLRRRAAHLISPSRRGRSRRLAS
jgi:hypothetical protein